MMLPSPTLPSRPSAPTYAGRPDASSWPSASEADEGVIRRADHRHLVPGLLRSARRDLEHAIERGMILLDLRQQPLEVRLDAGDCLPRNDAQLQCQFAFARRPPSRALK